MPGYRVDASILLRYRLAGPRPHITSIQFGSLDLLNPEGHVILACDCSSDDAADSQVLRDLRHYLMHSAEIKRVIEDAAAKELAR